MNQPFKHLQLANQSLAFGLGANQQRNHDAGRRSHRSHQHRRTDRSLRDASVNLLGALLGTTKKVLHAILGRWLGHPSGEVMDRNNKAPGQPANNTGGTGGLHDSPLERNGFELAVPVRQAKLTRSCR
jgi:hypothetical protein